ncbi:MAG: RNA polymerase factor sigma-54 [Bacteroidota bacterium]|nr:RNA polymerase factor sigma-54 [Bacteroidota bacterium]
MLNLQQKQSLQQRLSPQQIQYIKLLQLPTLALEQRIKQELEANPLLEEGEEELDEVEALDEQSEEDQFDDVLDSEDEHAEDDYDWEEFPDTEDDLYGYKAAVDHSAEEEQRETPLVSVSSMVESLRDQLSFLDLSDEDMFIAEQIIGSIDEDGYLRRPLESIVDDVAFNQGIMLSEDDVETMLYRIQRLDPVGVAARDLKECLLVQLNMLPEEVPGRDVAIEMLTHTYKAFTMKHFDQIMRRLGVEVHELKEAFELIQRLDPKPGEGEFSESENYITPDFTVRVEDDDFIITLNSGNAPELRVSRHYQQMLEKVVADKKKGRTSYDSDTQQFLRSKFESARWFINSINQRRQTMLSVMHAIVEQQEGFFREGEGNLRPMILKDIAEKIGMDISTISRVVNGKYVQTEFGVYELKYFFSEGLSTESGEDVSNKEVKALIDRIISEEDKKKPLSDQRIADLLDKKGFNIARRTVTKYREQLGIPVARLRKEIVLS